MQSNSIELKIEGVREGKNISPELLDVDEVLNLLANARDFLLPDKSSDRSRISVKIEEGSAILKFVASASIIVTMEAVLGDLQKNHDLAVLKPKQVSAIQNIQHFISKENLAAKFGVSGKLDKGLTIDRTTEWKTPDDVWIDEELYVTGEIIDVGGKTKPNIHLDTKELGTLTISASRDMLEDDDKNRLYKQQQLRVKVKRNFKTGELDKNSAVLLEYIDHDDKETADEYLDRLIAESATYWEQIGDPDKWLNDVRGYGE